MRPDGFNPYLPDYQDGALIGMTTPEERAFAHYYAREVYTGAGAIIDLGAWMGSLTIPMATGLAENPRATVAGRTVHAFDQFEWLAWMDRYASWTRHRYKAGESFRPEFEERVAHVGHRVTIHEVDLTDFTWAGGPIEFMFVDAMKDWTLNLSIARGFFPFLEPGRSILAFQDFGYYELSWLTLFLWEHRRAFEPLFALPGSPTVAFRLVRPFPVAALPERRSDRSFTRAQVRAAYDWAETLVTPRMRGSFRRGRVVAHQSRGETAEALEEYYAMPAVPAHWVQRPLPGAPELRRFLPVPGSANIEVTCDDATPVAAVVRDGRHRFELALGPRDGAPLAIALGPGPLAFAVRELALVDERRRVPLAVRAHNAVLDSGGTCWFEVMARLEVDLPPLAGPAVLELEVEPVAQGPALWPQLVQAQAFALETEREQHDATRRRLRDADEAYAQEAAEVLRWAALATTPPPAADERTPAPPRPEATPAPVLAPPPAAVAPPAVPLLRRVRRKLRWWIRGPEPRSARDATVAQVRESGIFDAAYYLATNPDVAAAGLDPAEHYVSSGDREGRQPHPLFDPAFYRARYAVPGDRLALLDYLGAADRDPGPEFSNLWYLSRYPDVAQARMNPLAHYLSSGRLEGRLPREPEREPEPDPAAAPAQARSGATRVIFAAADWHISGVNTFTAALANGLARAGFAAEILLTEPLSHVDRSHLPQVPIRTLPPGARGLPQRWDAMVRYLTAAAPCIFVPNYDFAMAAVTPGLPSDVGVIGILHSDDDFHYEQVYRLGRYFNATVAVSKFLEMRITEMNASLAPTTRMIPYGIDATDFGVPRARPVEAGCLRIVYSGRLEEKQKRVSDLPRIARALEARSVPYRLTIVGDGEERARLEAELAPSVAAGRVVFTGRQAPARIREELAAADVFLLVSNFEGLPLALLEALAAGTVPVVSRIASGVPDVVEEGVCGYTVPIGDVNAFADRLAALARAPEELARLSRGARAAFERGGYDAATMCARYADLFTEVARDLRERTYRRPVPFFAGSRFGRILPPCWMPGGDLR